MAENGIEFSQLSEIKYSSVHVVGALIVGLLLGGIITYYIGYTAQGTSLSVGDVISNTTASTTIDDTSGTNESGESTIIVVANQNNLLKVSDQNAGYAVIVQNAQVADTDWVAVQEEKQGMPGNVLGAARFVDGARMGTVELLRQTIPGKTYFVSIYKDEGNSSFSKSGDVQVKDPDGRALYVSFVAK